MKLAVRSIRPALSYKPDVTHRMRIGALMEFYNFQRITSGGLFDWLVDEAYREIEQGPYVFYISGTNGSYIELSDGRWADTVLGDSSTGEDAHDAMARLIKKSAGWIAKPTPFLTDKSVEWMAEHVGL